MKPPELKSKVKTDLRGHLEAVAAIFKRFLIGSLLLLETKSFFDYQMYLESWSHK